MLTGRERVFGPDGQTGEPRSTTPSSPSRPRNIDEVEVVTTDDDFIRIGQGAPLDPLTVDEHAVQAPIVEHPQPVGLRTISACRRDTVGSSKRMSAARLRPTRVHS